MQLATAALEEDRAFEDASTLAVVPATLQGRASLVARAEGVLAGLATAESVFRAVDGSLRLQSELEDGARVRPGVLLASIEGPVRSLLQAERTALNFLQRLSGVASITRTFADAVDGTGVKILDTRKTTPLFRDLEKYAVRCGGGTNHRRDLASMAMLKDNHLAAVESTGGTISDAIKAVRRRSPGIDVEVEIDSLTQLSSALAGNPEWILLDNMSVADMASAVSKVAGQVKLEASGGVTLESVRAIAETGVDAISVGALTHSAPALDISLDLEF